MLNIRIARPDELDWVNAQYRKVNFKPSNYKSETIAIAEWNGERAGLGRLVTIAAGVLELGGMYVDEAYRNYGIARAIVTFLLGQAKGNVVYCLPFAHLQGFYKSCGFASVTDVQTVPETIKKKWAWCAETYPDKTLLLVQQV